MDVDIADEDELKKLCVVCELGRHHGAGLRVRLGRVRVTSIHSHYLHHLIGSLHDTVSEVYFQVAVRHWKYCNYLLYLYHVCTASTAIDFTNPCPQPMHMIKPLCQMPNPFSKYIPNYTINYKQIPPRKSSCPL